MSPNPAILTWPRAVAGGGATLTYGGANSSTADSATYSLDVPIGTAATNRVVVCAVAHRKADPAATLSSATIGGVTATIDQQVASGGVGSGVAIIRATVPTGTTATVALTWSTTVLRCHVGAWYTDTTIALVTTATDVVGATGGTSMSTTLTGLQAGDHIISGAVFRASGGATWTGVDEDYDAAGESGTYHTGGHGTASAGDNTTTVAFGSCVATAQASAAYR